MLLLGTFWPLCEELLNKKWLRIIAIDQTTISFETHNNLSQYAGNSGWKTPHPNKNQFLLTLSAMLALTYMFAHVHSHFSYVQIESVGFARFSSRRCNRPVTESTTRFYPNLHCRLLVNRPPKTAV